MSDVAAAVVDHEKQGEVNLKLKIGKIDGTSQVTVATTLKFTRPTSAGKASEEETRATVFHVGRYGRMSITPENQAQMFTRDGEVV